MASDTIQYPNKKNLSSKLSREKKEKKKNPNQIARGDMELWTHAIKPNLTPSLRHTIMSNLITVFLAACPRAHDLKKTRLINPRKKQHYYFQAFYLIPLPGGSKVKMVEALFQSLHIPYIMKDLSFSTYIQFFLIYPMYVLIPFPLILYVTPYAMCFFFSLDIIITQTNYVSVFFNTIIQ